LITPRPACAALRSAHRDAYPEKIGWIFTQVRRVETLENALRRPIQTIRQGQVEGPGRPPVLFSKKIWDQLSGDERTTTGSASTQPSGTSHPNRQSRKLANLVSTKTGEDQQPHSGEWVCNDNFDASRIASPEIFPIGLVLPHRLCSREVAGAGDEEDQYDDAQ
jgi:hypothetical protein